MKLPESENYLHTSGQMTSYNMTIDEENAGLVMEMLRSKIYKDPIGSICREIAANCRDAHREVKSIAPVVITIHRPIKTLGAEGPSIEFTDFGPGISPERMATVFSKYAASTKRASNDFTGGFGLGAKTPFSYSDAFNVITRVDNTEYHYTCALDEKNRSQIILLYSKATDEPNGTTIQIPIKREDINHFEAGVLRATYFWKEDITLIGFNSTTAKVFKNLYEDDYMLLALGDHDMFRNSMGCIIDGIYYPVDDDIMNKTIGQERAGCTMLFKFQNGELTVAGNRENLQYDQRTIETLKARYALAQELLVMEIHRQVGSCQSYRELIQLLLQFDKNYYRHHYDAATTLGQAVWHWLKKTPASKTLPELAWDGRPLMTRIKLRTYELRVYSTNASYYNGQNYGYDPFDVPDERLNLPLYNLDVKSSASLRIRAILKEHPRFIAIHAKPRETDQTLELYQKWDEFRAQDEDVLFNIFELKPQSLATVTPLKNERKVEHAIGKVPARRIGYYDCTPVQADLIIETESFRFSGGSHRFDAPEAPIYYLVVDKLTDISDDICSIAQFVEHWLGKQVLFIKHGNTCFPPEWEMSAALKNAADKCQPLCYEALMPKNVIYEIHESRSSIQGTMPQWLLDTAEHYYAHRNKYHELSQRQYDLLVAHGYFQANYQDLRLVKIRDTVALMPQLLQLLRDSRMREVVNIYIEHAFTKERQRSAQKRQALLERKRPSLIARQQNPKFQRRHQK